MSRIKGYLSETAATNTCLQSEDMSTTWTTGRSSVLTDQTTAPNKTITADTIKEDATAANSHFITQTVSGEGGDDYVFSVWLKKTANRSWVKMNIWGATDSSAGAFFDLDNGVVGTIAGADGAYIEDWGNGWYRCIVYDDRTTAEDQYLEIYVAEADGDITFDGGNQDSLYVWGAQFETGNYPSSYVPTTTGTATRNKDQLRYKGDDGNLGGVGSELQGTLIFKTMRESDDFGVVNKLPLTLSDGGNTGEMLYFYFATDGKMNLWQKTGGSATYLVGGTNIANGVVRECRFTWSASESSYYIDEVSDATPITEDVPDDLDIIHIGMDNVDADQYNGLLSDIKIYKTVTLK